MKGLIKRLTIKNIDRNRWIDAASIFQKVSSSNIDRKFKKWSIDVFAFTIDMSL